MANRETRGSAGRKAEVVRHIGDQRAIPAAATGGRKRPAWAAYAYHTINIPEQENEKPYVDVQMSGTEKGKKGEEMPVQKRLWIKRGVDVMNVPVWAVHILVETAIETRFRQEERSTKNGGKKNAFIPFRQKSYPCTILESYNEPKVVEEEDEYQPTYSEPEAE